MKFLAILLGTILGIVLFLGIVLLIIYLRLKKQFRELGIPIHTIKEFREEMIRSREQDRTRVKSISGMTSLTLPTIREDFPEFNEQELYAKTEEGLRKVFSALEEQDSKLVAEYPLIRDSISKVIEDYKTSGWKEKYDDIKFHKFAIYQYVKKEGIATITVSVALEYYYEKRNDKKVLEDFTKYKKQTRYQVKFIYIYDESKVGAAKSLAINCPNCGAPITVLGHKYCNYCGSAVKEVNLKAWELSSYVEF